MLKLRGLDTDDKQFFAASVIAPIIIWWLFIGRRRYSVKGMK